MQYLEKKFSQWCQILTRSRNFGNSLVTKENFGHETCRVQRLNKHNYVQVLTTVNYVYICK
jgi:hypothetical protein